MIRLYLRFLAVPLTGNEKHGTFSKLCSATLRCEPVLEASNINIYNHFSFCNIGYINYDVGFFLYMFSSLCIIVVLNQVCNIVGYFNKVKTLYLKEDPIPSLPNFPQGCTDHLGTLMSLQVII